MARTPKVVTGALVGAAAVDVAGLRLRPLSLAGYMVLEREDSPFIRQGGTEIKAGDIALAALVLSADAEQLSALYEGAADDTSKAVLTMAAKIPVEHLPALAEAIVKLLKASTATVPAAPEKKSAAGGAPGTK